MPKEKPQAKPEYDEARDPAGREDQAVKRSYYYDDAYGYEEYEPEKERDEDDESED